MKKKEENEKKETTLESHAFNNITKKSSVVVDYDAYAHFLENSDLSENQKREFIQAIWSVISGFVSLGFGVHPVQELQNGQCGQVKNQIENTTCKNRNRLEFNNLNNQERSTKRIVADQSGVENAN